MELREKLALLDDMLELEEGTLTPETVLDELEDWDSVSSLSLIVILDENFNKKISGKEIKELKTVQDILNYMTEA